MNEKSGARATGGREQSGNSGSSGNSGNAAGLGRNLDHNRVIGLYLAVCVALTAIAIALLMSSCGGCKAGSVGSVVESSSTPVASAAVTQVTAVVASAPGAPAPEQRPTSQSSGNGLPPEIAVGELDTAVSPGQPVTFTVYGTPDVTQMSLWDGFGERQPMVHDTGSDVWRVDYRVPLRPKQEPIALSVTAKNEAGRWRRVWVFLHTQGELDGDCGGADSLSER